MATRPALTRISRRLVKPILPELPKRQPSKAGALDNGASSRTVESSNLGKQPSWRSKLQPEEYCSYRDPTIPVPEQLEYARRFFAKSKHSPVHLWTTNLFRKIPESDIPEVVFMGRSNVGKSSVINMLVGEDICYTSATPGRTQTMNAFGIGGTKGGETKINIIDSPGYGKASRPEWGHELMKYLSKRQQLRRVFLIIECKAGVKNSDKEVLSILREFTVPHQIIVSKADNFLTEGRAGNQESHRTASLKQFRQIISRIRKEVTPTLEEGIPPLGHILACSNRIRIGEGHNKHPLGIDALQWSILQAAGFDYQPSQTLHPQ
ncbi:ribosome biogenesis GTP-binding protein YsxC [Trichophyton rubrum D6]|uniref:GTP-binding protein 8 n=4 Tax=Trichophyton TaxID=5550 RepID=A0A178ESW2_TRIRU|nr:ribosome biogenesis GTP-binding protein YsxC [Trichophyton rubrum CBS 118892]EZF10148.1 ribosome biogenesis GTP-binding protein YsxC [Trichophyton rubrum MR850]EZF37041.1 ribosome biogenesis GTP-binding protein YsxC [Trichophyton rubrum CBS 100081]EZF47816.1 ribosome biogenesis GTP-binding protein YsxC [Trichophyton rubrum CBS 288.86]EZF58333.1 ribosome biogenesis GTP-binding protein YsxC [Trichophyton rubrum CBS 289.86]EZF69013.1 ribosome biogenesis GTP-binding protein YsxC [Trichophyton s